jgi:signal transduction histidine kinase
MLAQVERLGRLVAQLLDLSRLESQAEPFERAAFGVRDVLEAVVSEARLHAPDDMTFVVDGSSSVRASGDPERIHQVVANLVENAVKVSPPGGTVTLAVADDGRRVRLSVCDEGPGIPAAERDRVFERFYRADPARATGGAGLGLAIARWIVDLHGGSIRVEEHAPHGARMVVELPRA